jgi:hypothetical protein
LSENFLILRRTERDVIKDVYWFHVKYPLFSSDLNDSLNFLDRISRKNQMSNFMKILSVEAEFFHAGGTDNSSSSQLCVRALAVLEVCVPVMCTGCRAYPAGV